MAELTRSGIRLSDEERAALVHPLEDTAVAWAKGQSKLAEERAAYATPYAEARDAAFGRGGTKPDDVFSPIHDRVRSDFEVRGERLKLNLRKDLAHPGKPDQLVRGPLTGRESPPFDDAQVNKWELGNVISNPVASRSPQGGLFLQHFTGFDPQIEATSYAAIMFWAIPSTSDVLTFAVQSSNNCQINRLVHGVALHHSAVSASFTLFGSVQRVQLNPFQLVGPLQTQQTNLDGNFSIGENTNYIFDEAHQGLIPSVVSRPLIGGAQYAPTPDAYACWVWLAGHIRTLGQAGVQLDVSYTFDSIDVNVR